MIGNSEFLYVQYLIETFFRIFPTFPKKKLIYRKILQNTKKYVIVYINHNIMVEFCKAL